MPTDRPPLPPDADAGALDEQGGQVVDIRRRVETAGRLVMPVRFDMEHMRGAMRDFLGPLHAEPEAVADVVEAYSRVGGGHNQFLKTARMYAERDRRDTAIIHKACETLGRDFVVLLSEHFRELQGIVWGILARFHEQGPEAVLTPKGLRQERLVCELVRVFEAIKGASDKKEQYLCRLSPEYADTRVDDYFDVKSYIMNLLSALKHSRPDPVRTGHWEGLINDFLNSNNVDGKWIDAILAIRNTPEFVRDEQKLETVANRIVESLISYLVNRQIRNAKSTRPGTEAYGVDVALVRYRLLEYIRYGIHERRNDVAQALQGLMPYETARPEVRWLDKFNEKEPLR
ncbi:MAG: hypothetical protein V1908_03850, partial [Candidatus Peregrinibacteria bacterium]